MGDVLDLLLPSGRVTPLQHHSSARPNLHNTLYMWSGYWLHRRMFCLNRIIT